MKIIHFLPQMNADVGDSLKVHRAKQSQGGNGQKDLRWLKPPASFPSQG